jgi:dihydroneopterin triphosphate diphosphatase
MSSPPSIPVISHGVNCAVVRNSAHGWEVLLLCRAAGSIYAGHWGLVSGTKQEGETTPQVALREIAEETGLRPRSLWATEYVIQFYEPLNDEVWVLPVFLAVVDDNAEPTLCHENSGYVWADLNTATATVSWRNTAAILGYIFDELSRMPAKNWKQIPM